LCHTFEKPSWVSSSHRLEMKPKWLLRTRWSQFCPNDLCQIRWILVRRICLLCLVDRIPCRLR
jgi:hypothetical protein